MNKDIDYDAKFYNVLKISLFLGIILRGILLYTVWTQLMYLPLSTLLVIILFIIISPAIFSISMIYSLFNFTFVITLSTQYILASYIITEILWISLGLFFKANILNITNHKGDNN